MSTPTEPTGADDAREPDAAPASPDAPTAAYPSPDAATAAYPGDAPAAPPVPPAPGAYGQPAGAPAAQAPYGQQPQAQPQPQAQAAYGQQPYGQPAYGQPAYAATPSGPDTRPKTLAWVSLGLAILGGILACVGFLPVPWVGFVSVLVGGLALIVAFILSIVALASRKHGGKPIGIIALVVSVLGGGLWAVALFVSIALTAITSSSSSGEVPAPVESSSVAPSEEPGETEGETEGETPAGAYDEAAFLAEARPAIVAVFADVDPAFTEDIVTQMFPDESLIATGKSFLILGESGRDQMIETLVESSQGTFTDATAGQFVDAILTAAEKHLQE